MKTVEDRFWEKVREDEETGCWIWTAGTCNGYGQFGIEGSKRTYAHRFAYEALIGEIPEELQLDHLCRVRACVNPWHLEPVTSRVNIARGREAARAARATRGCCSNEHKYSEVGYYSYAGKVVCRACHADAVARYRRKNPRSTDRGSSARRAAPVREVVVEPKICTVDGCGRESVARGYCARCYQRVWRTVRRQGWPWPKVGGPSG